jgi:large subunit ribosomal protein L1
MIAGFTMAKKPTAEAAAAAPPSGAPPEAKTEAGEKPDKPAKEKKPKPADKAPGEQATAAPKTEAPAAGAVQAAKPAAPSGDGTAKKKGRPGNAPRRGKKLRNHLKNLQQKIAKEGPSPLKKALGLLKQSKRTKFDETVEIHMSLGIDSTQSDQLVRGTVPMPHGIGKSVRVVVFCQGENVTKAKTAGAEFAGADDLIEKIQKQNWLDFDVALATQDMMGKVSRLGKVLGPRGLMPTPKAGTVITGDVGNAVREFKAGKVEYRTDKGGNVHAGVGKVSFNEDQLVDNIQTFVEAIRAAKPAGVKGNYVKSITVSSTMGPGIPVTI